MIFDGYETPRLILDHDRLLRNSERFLQRAVDNDILLRPHLKTSKSVEVAKISTGGRMSSVTVSTLKEAEYFAEHGFTDILCAAGITPNKFNFVRRIQEQSGEEILLLTDSVSVAQSAVKFSDETGCKLNFLIEIDCGEHRGGMHYSDPALITIARLFGEGRNTRFRGVLTHGGHSYRSNEPDQIAKIAGEERFAVVEAASRLAAAGIDCGIVSAGSTPTFRFGKNFEGLTEFRCGVHVFHDLMQSSSNVCSLDDIALSVLASVIGHNRAGGLLTIDAGAFALSKDAGANNFNPGAGFGYVCDPVTMEHLAPLNVATLYQEHGVVPIVNEGWFDKLPVGAMVRILPNHSCPTAAAHDNYLVIRDGEISAQWPRMNGW